MKILIIHTQYTQAGGEDAVVAQEYELLKQEHTVELLYFKNKTGLKGALQFLVAVWNINAANKVRNTINTFQPDVIHLHNFHFAAGPLIIRTIKKKNIPLVHTLHNYRLLCPSAILLHNNQLFLDSLQQKFPWSAIKNRVYRNSYFQTFWLAGIIGLHKKIGTFKQIDVFITLTSFAVKLFQQAPLGIAADKWVVKPNFTQPQVLSTPPSRASHFLYVGRLSEEKGIRVLVKAMEGTAYTLKIVGDGPLKPWVTQQISTNANITYLGALNAQQVAHELSDAQALIFPSIWYETFGLTIIEAFSTKTPVIASNLGAPQSIIEHQKNGLHFEAGNAEALQRALAQWSSFTAEQKETMRNGAYASYQQWYAPEQQLAYFNSIYKKAMNQ